MSHAERYVVEGTASPLGACTKIVHGWPKLRNLANNLTENPCESLNVGPQFGPPRYNFRSVSRGRPSITHWQHPPDPAQPRWSGLCMREPIHAPNNARYREAHIHGDTHSGMAQTTQTRPETSLSPVSAPPLAYMCSTLLCAVCSMYPLRGQELRGG
jgi:hypothetical protein